MVERGGGLRRKEKSKKQREVKKFRKKRFKKRRELEKCKRDDKQQKESNKI